MRNKNSFEARAQAQVLLAISLAVVTMIIVACRTMTPVIPQSDRPSADGNDFNSGIIAVFTNGLAAGSWLVTEHWRWRYNRMIDRYGTNWGLLHDDGITGYTNGAWLVDRQHHEYFATMNRWSKQGL